jgi:type IV pilus assembly protein PilW
MNARTLQRGFSLVELMVAMLLSLVLLAGALSILYSSKVTYSESDRIARLQEAGRTVVELILRDSRAAGYTGCARPIRAGSFVNNLPNPNGLLWNFEQPIFGYDGSAGAFTPAIDAALIPDATPDSDVIVLRTNREGQPSFRLNAAVTSAGVGTLSVDRPSGATVPAGQTMVISDCRGAAAFVAGAFAGATPTTATINYAGTLTRTFEIDARVTTVDTVIYYVRPSTSGLGPALWRRVGAADPEPLIEGVENLQVLYGVDTNNDLLVDQYDTAAAVNAANNWNRVIALTLSILVRTENETNFDTDARTYNLLGQVKGPFNDRRQRSVFTTTVVLRNRTT